MVSTNTIVFRVTLVYHMCFCSHGLSLFNLNPTSGGHCLAKEPQPTAEVHVVHHGDPEHHGVGGHHVEVEHLDEVRLHVHQVP